jgi:hypothetical protein
MNSAPSSDPEYIRPRLLWRSVFRVGVLAFPAAVMLGLAILFLFPSLQAQWMSVLWGLGWGGWLFMLVGSAYLSIVPCPRCGKPFHRSVDGVSWNHFASKCRNCGVQLDGRNL